MARINNLTQQHISAIEKAFGVKLPEAYSTFMTRYPFPDFAYMRAEDLIELHEANAELITTVNENLRDPTLNPFAWKEQYFSVGERPGDEAIFYLDLTGKQKECPVFVLEPGALEGIKIADNFVEWADARVQELLAEDEKCVKWHNRQSRPWWKIW